MEYLLVSSCFAGYQTKYNGKDNKLDVIEKLAKRYKIIYVCPEVAGGLSIPRNPSEILGNKVFSCEGVDVTSEYEKGAKTALYLVKKYNIKKALLKESSPSCGSSLIYDGTFSKKKIKGMGITVRLLNANGVKIYSENTVEELLFEE